MNRSEYLSRAREFSARGNQLKHARLDPEKVRYIRRNPSGMTAKALAEKFGVHVRTVDKVRYYQSWGHVRDI